MWQVDNDRYQLWRLERQLAPKRIDGLLDSVTVADRPERPAFAAAAAERLAAAIRRLAKALYTPLPAATIVRRAFK